MTAVDRLADGYEPDHDIDREVGSQAELFVAHIIDSLGTSAIEVKHDVKAESTQNAYFELGCHYPAAGWRRTGVYATKAELWAHVLPGPVVVIAPLEVLRGVVDFHRFDLNHEARCRRGSHPTVGAYVPLSRLLIDLIAGRKPKERAA